MAQYLTSQDVENYGSELIDVAQRAALNALSPTLQQIQNDNAQLRQRLAQESRKNMDAAVERALPNFRELDRDPAWHTWLLGIDELSGRRRQDLLNEATASGDASRAIAFFRSFFSGPQQAAGQNVQQPAARRQQRQAPSGERTYTRAEVKAIYEQRRRGAYAGRDADWERMEHELIDAGRTGRILGGEPLS